MLESLIVFVVTIFLLFLILALMSLLFQRFNLQIVANEVAARVAQTYGYILVSEDARAADGRAVTDVVTRARIAERNPYRFRNYDDMDAAVQRIATEHARARLRNMTFTIDVGGPPSVSAIVSHDSLGRRHVAVEIQGRYIVPFREALVFFGVGRLAEYRVTGHAECMDLLHYINAVDTMKYWSSLKFLDSSFVDLIDNLLKMFRIF